MNRAAWCLLLVPLLAAGAESSKQEFSKLMSLKPDEARGRELFEACAACHGPDGGGTSNGSVPRIAGQHYRVLVRQVLDFRRGARWDMRMEDVATSHEIIPELQDIADVASYVSRLTRDGTRGVGDGLNVEKGAAIYAAGCGSCHGKNAEGDDASGVPRLSGQHSGYLARQIYDAVDGRRPPLAASHRKRFVKLDFQEVQGLADYLARLGWQDSAP
jgi:cytochrome c553